MCNACLHPSKASCRTVTYRSLISHVVLFKMLVEVQAATQGKIASKNPGRKEGQKQRISVVVVKTGSEDRVETLCFHPEFRFKYAALSRLLPGCVSETQSSGRLPLPGSRQRLGEPASSAHLCSSLISQILQRSFFFPHLFFPSPQTWIISKSTPGARCRSERDRGWCCCAERRHPREVSSLGLQCSLLRKMISA